MIDTPTHGYEPTREGRDGGVRHEGEHPGQDRGEAGSRDYDARRDGAAMGGGRFVRPDGKSRNSAA